MTSEIWNTECIQKQQRLDKNRCGIWKFSKQWLAYIKEILYLHAYILIKKIIPLNSL